MSLRSFRRIFLSLLFVLTSSLPASAYLNPGDITTVAGNGYLRHSGDGGPATEASMGNVNAVAVDSAGNVYIADFLNRCVRKVDANGIISTFAGNGTFGYTGDGGPATEASFSDIHDVAVGPDDSVYIADTSNHVVRKVDENGIVTTVAGCGTAGYAGDGGPATSAKLNHPWGISLNNTGNLYIADTQNSVVRKIDPDGIIKTYFDNYGNWINDIAADPFGNLFIVSWNRVKKINSDGIEEPINLWEGLTSVIYGSFDSSGNFYFADITKNKIKRYNADTGTTTNIAGTGSPGYSGDGDNALFASFNMPSGIAVGPTGNIFVSDTLNRVIRKINTDNIITTIAGNGYHSFDGEGCLATNISIGSPTWFAIKATGELYFSDGFPPNLSDAGYNRVRKLNSEGIVRTIAGNGGKYYPGDGVSALEAGFGNLQSIAFDNAGNLIIVDNWQGIRKINGQGVINTFSSLINSMGIAFGPYGNLFIADEISNKIKSVDANGTISDFAGNGSFSQLNYPKGLAFDSIGFLFVSEQYGNKINKIDEQGAISLFGGIGDSGFSGDGGPASEAVFNRPGGIAFDSSDNLFIADTDNHRIRRIDAATGIITTVAGDGNRTYAGDGGPAVSASLQYPNSVIFDENDNLYIADSENHRIRMVAGQKLYQLFYNDADEGAITPSPHRVGNYYPEGEEVTLTATPPPGYAFSHWSGDVSGTDYLLTITMDDDKQVIANYEPLYTLTVNVNPPEGGTYTLDPPGGSYTAGTDVNIYVLPSENFIFTGYTTGGISAGSDIENKEVPQAVVLPNPIVLTVTASATVHLSFAPSDTPQIPYIVQNGKSIKIHATMKPADGINSGKIIKFYISGGTWSLAGSAATDGDGVSELTKNLPMGSYKIKAVYQINESNIVDCKVARVTANSPATGIVTTDKTPQVSWEPYTGSTIVPPGEANVAYKVQICSNSQFTLGTYSQFMTTNTTAALPEFSKGEKKFWRVFATYSVHSSSLPSVPRSITYKEGTTLSGLDAGIYGNSIRPSVYLAGDETGALACKTVYFYYRKAGAATWQSLGYRKTDASGFVQTGVTKTLAAANYELRARFKGDAQYYKAGDTTLTISIGVEVSPPVPEPPPGDNEPIPLP